MRSLRVHIIEGQDVWDVAIQEHGTIEAVFTVLYDNPELDGLDTVLVGGQVVRTALPSLVATITEAPTWERATATEVTRRNQVHAMYGQSVWDIAIQEHGTIEAVFNVLLDNEEITGGLNSDLTPGQLLRVKRAALNDDVLAYYVAGGHHPFTGDVVALLGEYADDFADDFLN